ncbi:hypothetical protein [Plantactinospora sp. WMMB782]|uniref:hypothetical protein n=1 Tax=Plantactinospora sp. WMMB782 TaxID=3404121 RepID=UPI003B94B50C
MIEAYGLVKRYGNRTAPAGVDLAVDAGRQRVRTYPGGMRRRIDLAASLVSRARVLMVTFVVVFAPLALAAYRRSTR